MLHQAISLLLLGLGSITARIHCPYFDYPSWSSKTCSQSSYCQYTDATYINGVTGGETRMNVFDCGLPEKQVTSNTNHVESAKIPDNVKDIFEVEKSEYCPMGHGRWCRVTRGTQSCSHVDCKLIECRCNVDNCHAFLKDGGQELVVGGGNDLLHLLEELKSPNMTTEGGCSGCSQLRCRFIFLIFLFTLLYL